MDQLELRRVAVYPGGDAESDEEGIVILVSHFNVPAGLRSAETALSEMQVKVVPECKAVVLPMVKHPFVVGFLVAELPLVELETCVKGQSDGLNNHVSGEEDYSLPPFLDLDKKSWEIQTLRIKDEPVGMCNFTADQRSNAVDISQSLAMAYVMDQKAMLLQQSTWQNNVRMNNLVEQIRGPLSSIQTLGKILSTQTKKSEISYDIVEDILALGDRLSDVLQQLQDAVYLTKVLLATIITHMWGVRIILYTNNQLMCLWKFFIFMLLSLPLCTCRTLCALLLDILFISLIGFSLIYKKIVENKHSI